jgi:hypothetical protein
MLSYDGPRAYGQTAGVTSQQLWVHAYGCQCTTRSLHDHTKQSKRALCRHSRPS